MRSLRRRINSQPHRTQTLTEGAEKARRDGTKSIVEKKQSCDFDALGGSSRGSAFQWSREFPVRWGFDCSYVSTVPEAVHEVAGVLEYYQLEDPLTPYTREAGVILDPFPIPEVPRGT